MKVQAQEVCSFNENTVFDFALVAILIRSHTVYQQYMSLYPLPVSVADIPPSTDTLVNTIQAGPSLV